MSMYWEKLLDTVDKVHDKIFFFSANRVYVVMSLDHYESLTNKKPVDSDSLLGKFNDDIAALKTKMSVQNELELAENIDSEHIEETIEEEVTLTEITDVEEDNEFHIEPVEIR